MTDPSKLTFDIEPPWNSPATPPMVVDVGPSPPKKMLEVETLPLTETLLRSVNSENPMRPPTVVSLAATVRLVSARSLIAAPSVAANMPTPKVSHAVNRPFIVDPLPSSVPVKGEDSPMG